MRAMQIQCRSVSQSCITSFVQLLTTAHGIRLSDLLKVTLEISDAARADPKFRASGVPPKPYTTFTLPFKVPTRARLLLHPFIWGTNGREDAFVNRAP